jgi:hypothetical protein
MVCITIPLIYTRVRLIFPLTCIDWFQRLVSSNLPCLWWHQPPPMSEWAKKSKNRLNRENRKKNNQKNWTAKKLIKILKKPAGSDRFRFYKQKTEKTEPNRNQKNKKKKPSQTEKTEPNRKNRAKTGKNRAKPVWTGFCPKKPNRTKTGRFDPVSIFFYLV